ncbi:hypothetical protein LAZ67_22001356 [Cordylochernes scorpioides]|uniref:Fibrinogen C-terminal domain-containing protein n=1 Tax=Cordylochernes scorpioides TaxID=51811 RepID=A0ABY6LT60_9ARAC|nr:hypothetical protein LAZ67_22001356 [Cordylochernes scorpioides]
MCWYVCFQSRRRIETSEELWSNRVDKRSYVVYSKQTRAEVRLLLATEVGGRKECKNARVDAMLAVMTNLALDTQEVLSGVPASATWWTPSKRCCLKRSDCCLPPTPVYFLENSRRFYELLFPVLLLLSYTVLQLGSEECKNARVDAMLAVMTNLALDTQEVLSGVPASDVRKTYSSFRPLDCSQIQHAMKGNRSGAYQLWSPSRELPVKVYCDQETDDGGWIITSRDHWQLRVDLWHVNGTHVYATYEDFWIGDEAIKYKLHLSNYKGTAVRIHPQRTTHKLTIAIEQEWALISNELLDALISITKRRCKF